MTYHDGDTIYNNNTNTSSANTNSNNSRSTTIHYTSSSSIIFPLPFFPPPFNCIPCSSRVRQRYNRSRLSTSIINSIIHSLNNLYFPSSSYSKVILSSPFETANSSSIFSKNKNKNNKNNIYFFSSIILPSRIHKRVLDYISSSVRDFIADHRGSTSSHSSKTRDINISSFPLSFIYQSCR